MDLEPLPQLGLADRVEHSLLHWIARSGLEPGHELPSEQDLATQLGISRASLREALARLRLLGLVRSRRRRGMVLAQPNPLIGFDLLCSSAQVIGGLARELWDLRLLLEDALAERLFARASLEDLVQLEAVVQDQTIDPFDLELARRCDRAFHAQLYRVAAPQLAQRLLTQLAGYFEARLGPARAELQEPVGHDDLLDLLRNGSPPAFRRALGDHLAAMGAILF